MKNKTSTTLAILTAISLVLAASIGCASRRKIRDVPPPERFRVGLINAGVYRSLADQASMDLSSLGEIELLSGSELDSVLAKSGLSQKTVIDATTFDRVATAQSIDFVLVLLPAPATFVSGAIGLKSFNWRTKSMSLIPGMKVPTQPAEWLVDTGNGWARFTSDPTGARVSLNGKVIGATPILRMMEPGKYSAFFEWTPKYNKTLEIDLGDKAWVYVRAPDEYGLKKESGWYARLQAADERHGPTFFIIMFVIIGIASTYFLVAGPTVK